MVGYLAKHPEFDKVFCRSCNTLKPREDMHSMYRCEDCYLFAKRARDAKRREAMRMAKPEPKPEPKPAKPLRAKTWGGKRTRTSMADRAAICEEYFGLGMQLGEIAKKRNLHHETISRIISRYLGNGTPVTMVIPFDTE